MNSINHLYNKNGLTIATDTAHDFESVTLSILVKNGSRNESKENNGISHFLEHMAFKGTSVRTARNIAEEFDMMGGYFNAYTSRTSTVYYAKILKNDLTKAIDIMADILINSIFVQAELEKERYVILQELCMTNDTPDDIIFDYFQETAFKNQALGNPILGTKKFIQSLTRKELCQYFINQYSTRNTIISAAGNFYRDDFILLVNKKFKNFRSNSIRGYDQAHYTGGEIYIKKDLEQTQFLIGFEGVSYLDKSFLTYKYFLLFLGGGCHLDYFKRYVKKEAWYIIYHLSIIAIAIVEFLEYIQHSIQKTSILLLIW